MTSEASPAAALRSAMRGLLSMFRETLGDEAGASALKTAVERALSEVGGVARKPSRQPSKARPRPAAKAQAQKPAAAPRAGKRKRKPSPPSAGRLRQIAAMKSYWKRKKAEAGEKEEPSAGATT